MLTEKNDIEKLNNLIHSLKIFSISKAMDIKRVDYETHTNSLYRFGWFYINGYKHSISGWNFRKDIIIFEDENTGKKIKYNINTSSVIGEDFIKNSVTTKIQRKLKRKLSRWLRKLSDQLQS